MVNEEKIRWTDLPIEKLNPLFGYETRFRPQGFPMIKRRGGIVRAIFDQVSL